MLLKKEHLLTKPILVLGFAGILNGSAPVIEPAYLFWDSIFSYWLRQRSPLQEEGSRLTVTLRFTFHLSFCTSLSRTDKIHETKESKRSTPVKEDFLKGTSKLIKQVLLNLSCFRKVCCGG
ncbi:hypothetical protein ACU8KH_04996 [Lachancea thermotolerans]